MSDTTSIKTPGTPKPWINAMVSIGLKTPGLRKLLGRSLALITVTGAKSGTRYTTPIQFQRDGDRFLVTSQRHRRWWKNISSHPDVELLVAGELIRRTARIADDDEAPALLELMLRRDSRLAKFYGIEVGDDGSPDPGGVAALDEAVVVIVVG